MNLIRITYLNDRGSGYNMRISGSSLGRCIRDMKNCNYTVLRLTDRRGVVINIGDNG